ncbi:MAG: PorP/SprF family type IX secretion system membrane protein [Chitinophagales bacterium]|nr:PorP/SprF family type IX secretion system membrane protein [Chitinophagales bacterium]
MKNFYRSVVVCAMLLLLAGSNLFAQDARFSQYNASPLILNPAMTGLFQGSYRINAIYRSQWHSILKSDDPSGTPLFRTFSASTDFRLPVGKKDGFGVGVVFLSDKAGAASFSSNQVNLSLAYAKALNNQGTHFLSLGLQAGACVRGINYTNLRFGAQFDGEGFNPSNPNGETLPVEQNFTFFDVSAGLFYYGYNQKNKGRTNYYAGVSIAHINRPNQSFFDGADADLYMKITGTAGASFPVGPRIDIQPSVMVLSQGPAFETNVGSFVKVLFEPNKPNGNAFYVGPWYRIVTRDNVTDSGGIASEALILVTRIDYSSFTLGFSFDLNLSELTNATNTNGGFEISAAHIGSFAKKNKTYFCPRF